MQIYLSLLVALAGMLVNALCSSPKLQELGRLAFFCGLLSFLLCFCQGGRVVGILKGVSPCR